MTAPDPLSAPVPPAVHATHPEGAEAGSVDLGASGEGQHAASEPPFPLTPLYDWLKRHLPSMHAGQAEAALLASKLDRERP